MSAPYLEEIEEQIKAGPVDIWLLAERIGADPESILLSLNNGILKGYWHIALGRDPRSEIFSEQTPHA